VLFLMGAALVYFVMLPFVLWFSLSQQITGGGAIEVQLLPKVSDYLSLVTTLLHGRSVCRSSCRWCWPWLGIAGLVSSKLLREGRRYAIVGVIA
jgi:sec-independent protein translocase protein TatC